VEELLGEVTEMMDMIADSNVMIFSPIKKVLQAWRHRSTNPSHDSKSVCTEPTVDTNNSLDCTNDDEVILTLCPELFEFTSDLESELEANMDEVFRFDSGYCPSVATTPTILMPSLLDTDNPSNMRIPSECHLTLSDTVDCIVDPLPLEDLRIVGHSDKKGKGLGDEGIGVDGLKELDPGPYTHDGIQIDDIMEHGPSPIHYELVPSPPVMSNHIISAFQQGH
jgi:hypothetical protein